MQCKGSQTSFRWSRDSALAGGASGGAGFIKPRAEHPRQQHQQRRRRRWHREKLRHGAGVSSLIAAYGRGANSSPALVVFPPASQPGDASPPQTRAAPGT
ncbi:hypothetical protein QQF64_023445 [Cirrhinus molitorella]|uniref:Uncharacterized protein n=1 Tax=Cirrhinus molitorella TaxID=172907 RepID=A0ABR3L8Q9_9TELE